MVGKSPVRRIAGNTAVQVFGRAIEFAIFLFLVHYLDLKTFGAYAFILTNLMLWGVLADAGTYNVLIREAAGKANADRLLGNALTIGLSGPLPPFSPQTRIYILQARARKPSSPRLSPRSPCSYRPG